MTTFYPNIALSMNDILNIMILFSTVFAYPLYTWLESKAKIGKDLLQATANITTIGMGGYTIYSQNSRNNSKTNVNETEPKVESKPVENKTQGGSNPGNNPKEVTLQILKEHPKVILLHL